MYKIGKNLKINEKIENKLWKIMKHIEQKFKTVLFVWKTWSMFIIYRFIIYYVYFFIFSQYNCYFIVDLL